MYAYVTFSEADGFTVSYEGTKQGACETAVKDYLNSTSFPEEALRTKDELYQRFFNGGILYENDIYSAVVRIGQF